MKPTDLAKLKLRPGLLSVLGQGDQTQVMSLEDKKGIVSEKVV